MPGGLTNVLLVIDNRTKLKLKLKKYKLSRISSGSPESEFAAYDSASNS